MNKQLGRFELHEQIDVGGYTTVYRAVEDLGQGLTRPAAVKALQAWNLDDEEQISRLKREVGMLVEIGDAPNIVSVHGMGIDEELGPWIAMELAGRSLRYSITDKPSEPNHVRSLLRDVLHALQWVHGTTPPILHRDLKPQNILRTGPGIWKVADFGLAKKTGAEETMQLATVKYAAPELLDSTLGEESPRVDIYALGMIAYEMALGKTLFEAQFPSVYDPMGGAKDADADDRPKWMYWHTSMQMVLPPLSELVAGYPQDLSDLIQSMISKSVNDRVASADDALERLGQVSTAAPALVIEDDDEESQKPSILPKVIGAALTVLVIGAVAAMMWVFLEGRPKILLPDNSNQFATTSSTVRVSGTIENFPENGRAEIKVQRGGSRSFTVDFDGQGGFSSDIKLSELGSFQATMTIRDSTGRRAASQALELVRSAPEFVSFELKTKPIVSEANVTLRPIGGDHIQLTTNAMGVATSKIPFGEFTLELVHPRYQPIPRSTQQTGIESEWTKTANLIPRDFSALLVDMQREIDRLMGLTKRKTTCPPGPLTEAEEQQLSNSVGRLRQLANGDADIELFLESVASTKDCDPTSMPAAPPLPQDPGSPGGLGSSDPVGQLDRLLDRVERLIDRKVTCPPGPLSAFEESTLETTLLEIEAIALGDLDIQLYVDSIRRVNDCDPSSRPERPEIPESLRQQLIAAAGGGTALAGTMGSGGGDGSDGTGGRDGYGGSDGTSGKSGKDADMDALRAEMMAMLNQNGSPNGSVRGGNSASEISDGRAAADSVIASVLAGMPPNPELVKYLTETLTLEEFAAFVKENVPTGAVRIEMLPDVDKVRIHGSLFNASDLEWMVKRLAYGWTRIQPELNIDPWDVCRLLSSAMESNDAVGVRVKAYLVSSDPTMFVQFKRGQSYSYGEAVNLAKSFVIDQGLVWIRSYVDTPAKKMPDKQPSSIE